MVRWTAEKIESLAKAYFQHIDGVITMEGGWDELSPNTKKYFIERMEWAIKTADV